MCEMRRCPCFARADEAEFLPRAPHPGRALRDSALPTRIALRNRTMFRIRFCFVPRPIPLWTGNKRSFAELSSWGGRTRPQGRAGVGGAGVELDVEGGAPPGRTTNRRHRVPAPRPPPRSRLAPGLGPPHEGEGSASTLAYQKAWSRLRRSHAGSRSRSLKRWILPVAVFGNSSTTSIQRGYFQAPMDPLTCSFNAAARSSDPAPFCSTT